MGYVPYQLVSRISSINSIFVPKYILKHPVDCSKPMNQIQSTPGKDITCFKEAMNQPKSSFWHHHFIKIAAPLFSLNDFFGRVLEGPPYFCLAGVMWQPSAIRLIPGLSSWHIPGIRPSFGPPLDHPGGVFQKSEDMYYVCYQWGTLAKIVRNIFKIIYTL